MKYYSQFGQDKWVNTNIFNNKENGFFIEVGADDGVDKSNTKFFEELGWQGICIEPSPIRYKYLKSNRICITENIAISNSQGKVEFMDIKGYGKGLSGICQTYTEQFKTRIKRELINPKNEGHNIIQVSTNTLTNILNKHNAPSVIDFCSIDTEGHELQVLESLDFNKYNIKTFTIESNDHNSKLSVSEFLKNKGYKLTTTLGPDTIFCKIDN